MHLKAVLVLGSYFGRPLNLYACLADASLHAEDQHAQDASGLQTAPRGQQQKGKKGKGKKGAGPVRAPVPERQHSVKAPRKPAPEPLETATSLAQTRSKRNVAKKQFGDEYQTGSGSESPDKPPRNADAPSSGEAASALAKAIVPAAAGPAAVSGSHKRKPAPAAAVAEPTSEAAVLPAAAAPDAGGDRKRKPAAAAAGAPPPKRSASGPAAGVAAAATAAALPRDATPKAAPPAAGAGPSGEDAGRSLKRLKRPGSGGAGPGTAGKSGAGARKPASPVDEEMVDAAVEAPAVEGKDEKKPRRQPAADAEPEREAPRKEKKREMDPLSRTEHSRDDLTRWVRHFVCFG